MARQTKCTRYRECMSPDAALGIPLLPLSRRLVQRQTAQAPPLVLVGAASIVECPMRSALQLFLVSSATPNAPPEPGAALEVEAKTEDALLQAARALLVSRGHRIRALSFGTKGLVAYVEKPA